MTTALLLAVSFATLTWAPPDPPQAEPMITDRPDFTESPFAVGPGRVQIEMGYTFAGASEAGQHTFGEALIRVGLVHHFELRIEAPSLEFLRDDAAGSDTGFSDAALGFKWHAIKPSGLVPAVGIIVGVSLPTGSDPFSAGTIVPAMTVAWAYDLTESLGLSGNVGIARSSDEGGRFWEPAASISLSSELSDRLGGYAEYFALFPTDGRGDAHSVNVGLTYLVTENLQLDCRVGAGLSPAAAGVFAGIGFARRW